LHNKPLGCGASEVYASGPDSEEEEEEEEEKEDAWTLKHKICFFVGLQTVARFRYRSTLNLAGVE